MIKKKKGHSLPNGKVIAMQFERRLATNQTNRAKIVEPEVAFVLVESACVVGIFALVIHGKG
jgi:hypothetical protein